MIKTKKEERPLLPKKMIKSKQRREESRKYNKRQSPLPKICNIKRQ